LVLTNREAEEGRTYLPRYQTLSLSALTIPNNCGTTHNTPVNDCGII